MNFAPKWRRIPPSGPAAPVIDTHSGPRAWITEALLQDGSSEEDTANIMGGNYLRVLREVLPA